MPEIINNNVFVSFYVNYVAGAIWRLIFTLISKQTAEIFPKLQPVLHVACY